MNARPSLNTIQYPIAAEKHAFPLSGSRLCAENIHQLVDMLSTDFRHFIAKTCIFLFFIASASKTLRLLITAYAAKPNPIRTNFDSNVAIRTFRGVLSLRAADASLKTVMPKNKLCQTEACCHFAPPTERRAVTSRRRQRGVLSLRAADSFAPFPCEAGEGLGMGDIVTSRRRQRGVLSLRAADREACFVHLPQCFG
jgi:hypothetical protein